VDDVDDLVGVVGVGAGFDEGKFFAFGIEVAIELAKDGDGGTVGGGKGDGVFDDEEDLFVAEDGSSGEGVVDAVELPVGEVKGNEG